MQLALLDPEGDQFRQEGPGEIVACGGQVSPGYWHAPHIDAEKFILRDGKRWYRTGDVGRWSKDYGFLFAGRADRQIKIRGFRVELIEIEGAVRKASGRENVAVIPWPMLSPGNAGGCVAFIGGPEANTAAIVRACAGELPDYMVPTKILFCPDLPINENGKVDHRALATDARLQQ
jgi:mycobactin phenyloxazoline synthetase